MCGGVGGEGGGGGLVSKCIGCLTSSESPKLL